MYLVSPNSDGSYTANYELHDSSGKPIPVDKGKYIWVTITVGTVAAVVPTTSGTTVPEPTGIPSVSSATVSIATGTRGSCPYVENAMIVSQMLDLINSARIANSLSALPANNKLNAAAMVHSIDMACSSLLSHTGSDGTSPKARAAAQGYTSSYIEEAIYAQPPQYDGTTQAAVDWWLNDPPHRAILLSTKAKEIGLGYADVAGSALVGYFDIEVAAP